MLYSAFQVACPVNGKGEAELTNQMCHTVPLQYSTHLIGQFDYLFHSWD